MVLTEPSGHQIKKDQMTVEMVVLEVTIVQSDELKHCGWNFEYSELHLGYLEIQIIIKYRCI